MSGFNRGFDVVGDLALTADGRDIALVTGKQKIAQRLRTRAQIFRGSWKYDRQIGVPYFQEILVTGASFEVMRKHFYDLISGTEGVATVQSLTLTIDRTNGTLYVNFTCSTNEGELLQESLDFVAAQTS